MDYINIRMYDGALISNIFLSIVKKCVMYTRNSWYLYGVFGSIT